MNHTNQIPEQAHSRFSLELKHFALLAIFKSRNKCSPQSPLKSQIYDLYPELPRITTRSSTMVHKYHQQEEPCTKLLAGDETAKKMKRENKIKTQTYCRDEIPPCRVVSRRPVTSVSLLIAGLLNTQRTNDIIFGAFVQFSHRGSSSPGLYARLSCRWNNNRLSIRNVWRVCETFIKYHQEKK